VRDFGWAEDGNGSKAESLRNGRMSAFASSSGHTSARAFSSFVPIPDSCTATKSTYSITSSARASSVGGISRPIAFAVPTLITSSNLVGCITGRSAGLVPMRILPV
jgi:hypothetical protein